MKLLSSRLAWGMLLIVGGIAFLLQNLGIMEITGAFFGVIFMLAGLVFLITLLTDREQWWAVIPGTILTYLGFLILANNFFPGFEGAWGGAGFLAAISLAFWLVYFLKRDFWWAIIPAGVLLTLAVITAFSEAFSGVDFGGAFFLGLGLTFALLTLVRTPEGRMRWPLIPAGILLAMGLVFSAFSASILNYVWSIGLILAGLYLFFFRRTA